MLCLSPNKQSLSFILLLLQPWLLNFRRKETPRSGVQPVESSCSRSAKYVCLATIYLLRNCFHVFYVTRYSLWFYCTWYEQFGELNTSVKLSHTRIQRKTLRKNFSTWNTAVALQKQIFFLQNGFFNHIQAPTAKGSCYMDMHVTNFWNYKKMLCKKVQDSLLHFLPVFLS